MKLLGLPIDRTTIIIAVLVLALGMFAFNQFTSYYYKVQLMMNPCDACVELNPHLMRCFNGSAIIYNVTYISKPEVNWSRILLENSS